MPSHLSFVLCGLLVATAWLGRLCDAQEVNSMPMPPDDAYAREVIDWRAKHEQAFKSPQGWLALTGHYWLVPGANHFGSQPNSRIHLPEAAARSTEGNFVLDPSGKVTLMLEAGDALRINDQPAAKSTPLTIEAHLPEANGLEKIAIGERLSLQLVRRAGRLAVRVRDSQSELIGSFKGKHWFPVRADLRVPARFERFDSPKHIRIVNIQGDQVETNFAGALEFVLSGRPLRLDAIEEEPGRLFVIFKDQTNGRSTYGAGRFVDVDLPSTGDPVIDFNKCYHPPCAWSPYTLCPMPPKQNELPVAIEAGESM